MNLCVCNIVYRFAALTVTQRHSVPYHTSNKHTAIRSMIQITPEYRVIGHIYYSIMSTTRQCNTFIGVVVMAGGFDMKHSLWIRSLLKTS
jgi:hypothetical protein